MTPSLARFSPTLLVVALLRGAAPQAAPAQCVPATPADTALPDTPPGRAMRRLLERYNSGALQDGYWQRYVQSYGQLRLCAIRTARPASVQVWARGILTGSYLGLSVDMKEDSLNVVDGYGTIQGIYPKLPGAPRSIAPADLVPEARRYLAALDQAGFYSGAVLIGKGDSVIFRHAYGQASIRYRVPNTVDTRFNIGSITKVLTAIAIGQLVEAGKLAYQDSVGKHLPDYPGAARRVTIHQLLTHTSGMARVAFSDTGLMSKTIRSVQGWLPLTVGELDFPPGSSNRYSNEAFVVLGAIIERVSGSDYYEYVRTHIYEPAGMANSGAFDLDQEIPRVATDYTRYVWLPNAEVEWDPGPVRVSIVRRGMKGSPAGGTLSTVDDLFKLSRALQGHHLLGPEHLDRMMTPQVTQPAYPGGDQVEGYGYGTETFDIGGVVQVGKDGSIQGSSARWLMFPGSGYTLVLLANRDFAAHRAGDYLAELIRRLAPAK